MRHTSDPADVESTEAFHYSIPSLDERGDGAIEPISHIGSNKLRLHGGEVLISKLNPRISRVFKAVQHAVPTLASTEFIALIPGPELDSSFLSYWLESEVARQLLEGATMSVTRSQQRVRPEVVTGAWIDLPILRIQRAIADYLDRETARIDALIAAKRRMVELLEERWVAVRGQLTGVASTDGEWASVQLRRIARIQAGAAFPHGNQGDAAGTIPYIKVGDLSNVDAHDRLGGPSNRVSPEVAQLLRSPVLPSGTIVLPKIGAALLTNRRAVLSEPSCLDQNVMGVTVHDGIPEFVYYCLSSIDLGDLSTPGPVPLLNEEAALAIRIPWPPIDRQRAIVQELDTHRAAAKAPVTLLAKQRDVLQERRQALVTAVVTGQLEMPEAA